MTPTRKMANAFYAEASPSNKVNGVDQYVVKRFKKKHGGLWVGGSVVVSDREIEFSPNELNKRFHDHLESVHIEASDIESVKYKFGWFTGIVEVTHTNGTFRFRCYGAKKLVELYNQNSKLP